MGGMRHVGSLLVSGEIGQRLPLRSVSDLLNVCPVGFLPSRFNLANVEYRLRKQGEQPWLLAWRDALVRTQDAADSFLSPETLTLSPRLN